MRDLVNYLLKIEKMAGDLYKDASAFFAEDKNLAGFLSILKDDEMHHFELMTEADAYLKGKTDETPAFVSLDSSTREKIERSFVENRELLLAKTLSKEDMINLIVSTEFSEWNDVFLYVVNTLRQASRNFEEAAADIQEHKQRIEDYLESLPDGDKYLERIRSLPAVWEQTVLVVEDDAVIIELLSAMLSREYVVQSAENGKAGLEKIKRHHFDVIISDVTMPVMDGLEFFQQALEIDQGIAERFLFFTGYPTPESLTILEKHNLKYLTKPADLDKIKQVVHNMMHGAAKDH
jgi:CheY-like chemotaxis protein